MTICARRVIRTRHCWSFWRVRMRLRRIWRGGNAGRWSVNSSELLWLWLPQLNHYSRLATQNSRNSPAPTAPCTSTLKSSELSKTLAPRPLAPEQNGICISSSLDARCSSFLQNPKLEPDSWQLEAGSSMPSGNKQRFDLRALRHRGRRPMPGDGDARAGRCETCSVFGAAAFGESGGECPAEGVARTRRFGHRTGAEARDERALSARGPQQRAARTQREHHVARAANDQRIGSQFCLLNRFDGKPGEQRGLGFV